MLRISILAVGLVALAALAIATWQLAEPSGNDDEAIARLLDMLEWLELEIMDAQQWLQRLADRLNAMRLGDHH